MVKTPALKTPETPAGKLPAVIDMEVAPAPAAYVIGVMLLFIQISWFAVAAAEVRVIVLLAWTVIVPLKDTLLQGPVVETV